MSGTKSADAARTRLAAWARRPGRACCRAARTCCRAARGCRAPACAPSAGSARTALIGPFAPVCARTARSRAVGALPGPAVRSAHSACQHRRRSSRRYRSQQRLHLAHDPPGVFGLPDDGVELLRHGLRIAHRDRVLVQHFEQRGHRIELGRQRLDGAVDLRAATSAAGASARGSSQRRPRALRQIGVRPAPARAPRSPRSTSPALRSTAASRSAASASIRWTQPVENHVQLAALFRQIRLRDAVRLW